MTQIEQIERIHGLPTDEVIRSEMVQIFKNVDFVDPFTGIEDAVLIPQRPLGALSDFAVGIVPLVHARFIEGTNDGAQLLHDTEFLAEQAQVHVEAGLSPEDADLAQLDACVVQDALHTYGIAPGHKLTSLVERLSAATGMIPRASYEALTEINPIDIANFDPRTFTGTVAEIGFYRTHGLIESDLAQVIDLIQMSMAEFPSEFANSLECFFHSMNTTFARVVLTTGHMIDALDGADFNRMRQYLSTREQNEQMLKGASAAFSARIPLIDFLTVADIPEKSERYVADNRKYFPRNGQREMDEAIRLAREHKTLPYLIENHPNAESLRNDLQIMRAMMHMFRLEHYRLAVKFIPEAIHGHGSGTGGEADAGSFLRDRIKSFSSH